ncbi:uncharacterized protein [Antedon mediterranea]|uniref:uncharacterized protein n=1 Tax=Antedon mediterranea TaxID=105859 RepID=UPI003AF4F68B
MNIPETKPSKSMPLRPSSNDQSDVQQCTQNCEDPSTDAVTSRHNEAPPSHPQPVIKTSHGGRKQTVLIIGDSIPKHLVGRRMSSRMRVINCCIPGSKLEMWIKLAPVLIQEQNPSSVIIHCGTNNTNDCMPMKCIKLITLLCNCIRDADTSIHIAISSLIMHQNAGRYAWVKEFNARLHDKCSTLNWAFIDNSNISLQHLAKDGLHLNGSGIKLIAMNYIAFLRDLAYNILQT